MVDADEDSCCATVTPEALASMPVFPLPDVIFFPHTVLPLHIFEPRYRQMTSDLLAGHRLLAVANIVGEGEAIADVAGLGRVVHHQKLPDGRYHLVLQGVGRVRVVHEHDRPEGQLYRTAQVELLDDERVDACDVDGELATIRSCYQQLVQHMPEVESVLGDLPNHIDCPEVLGNMLCTCVLRDADERQAALETSCVRSRLHMAAQGLASLLLDVSASSDVN